MPRETHSNCLPFLRALSDESRWRIVRLLTASREGLTLSEIAQKLDLSDYNASRHVRILSESGILTVEREGRFKQVRISRDFRNRSEGGALDLGCCRFDFSEGAEKNREKQLRNNASVFCIRRMSVPARYIMIGGFLGAGKTTAIVRVARDLSGQGKKVGLITNDQGRDLVDTRMLRSQGFATEEIPGGCFCCKFDSLVDAAGRLTEEVKPEVFLAEPVGSCTDLVATVTYPLRRIYGERFEIAPLSVLIDPMRARRVLGLEPGRSFSEKVIYIFKKQLQEADLIVISKNDLLTQAGEREVREALKREFSGARVLSISAREGDGLEAWLEILESENQTPREAMAIDYDTYAEGEALLGWLNATIDLTVCDEMDAGPFLSSIATEIQHRLQAEDAEVAHLKITLSPDRSLAGEVAVVNLVRNDFRPEFGQELEEPIAGGQMILNLRAEADSERLEFIVREALEAVASGECHPVIDHLERFRPGRPEPTHREPA